MLIVYRVNNSIGWHSINYMVELAAKLLEADILYINQHKKSNKLEHLRAINPMITRRKGQESCLLICQSPTYLSSLFDIPDWQSRFGYIAAWVIDSFWTDRIPQIIKFCKPFDKIYITTEEDIPEWTKEMKTPTSFLPWGTDVLYLGGNYPEKTWDLIRVGRQPPEWENDLITKQLFETGNLKYHGRPKKFKYASENQTYLMNLYKKTKFLLAFSNRVNSMNYTHPIKEYLTARWVDALACGATLVGIPPRSPTVDHLLWIGATIDLGTIKREEGYQVIVEAVRNWKPEVSQKNYQKALERLDWRWRFMRIAEDFKESPSTLNTEIQVLRQSIN